MRFSFAKMLVTMGCAVILLLPSFVSAADVFFSSTVQRMEVGQEFLVRMMVNTEQDVVNAVEGTLLYPEDLLEVKAIRDGNSVVNLWAEKPQARGGLISFAGITPGGFSGERDMLFTVVFRAKNAGTFLLRGQDFRLLKNEDSSEVDVDQRSLQLAVLAGGALESVGETDEVLPEEGADIFVEQIVVDRDPPESFTPEISSDPHLFDGAFFVVFATQDKGSGVARYEIQEGGGDFVEAESPYVLKDQALGKRITVKAIDNEGNERLHVLEPLRPRPYGLFVVGGVVLLGCLFLLVRKIWRR